MAQGKFNYREEFVTTTYEHWDMKKLKNHRLNAKVFGEIGDSDADKEFVASIKRGGVTQPAVVAGDGTIISGHRRRQGAARAGLKKLDVIVRRDLTTPEQIDRAWFEANLQREMTTEQKARWFKEREAIEAAEAAKRQAATLKKGDRSPVTENFPQRGEAANIAASEVGMSGKTARAAAKVVEVIDEAEAKGDKETAAKLRETLNGQSVSAAKREADKVKPPAKKRTKKTKPTSTAKIADELSRKHVSPLVKGIDKLADMNGGKGEFHEAATSSLDSFIAALKKLREGKQ